MGGQPCAHLGFRSQGTFMGGRRTPPCRSSVNTGFPRRPMHGLLAQETWFLLFPAARNIAGACSREHGKRAAGWGGRRRFSEADRLPGAVRWRLRLVHHPHGPCGRTVVRGRQVSHGTSLHPGSDRQCFKFMGILLLFCCTQDGDVEDLPA